MTYKPLTEEELLAIDAKFVPENVDMARMWEQARRANRLAEVVERYLTYKGADRMSLLDTLAAYRGDK